VQRFAIVGLLAAVLAAPIGVRAASAAGRATTVGVKMTEFKFALTKASVRRGVVVFRLANAGTVPHDFKINGKKSPLVAPGKTATLTVTFTKRGKYPYECTVAGHAQAGMKGILAVR
jgi:uncharacterized cupredoxin-like copper-binding protein